MRLLAALAAAAAALGLASAAPAAGPWLGVLDGGEGIAAPNAAVSYVANIAGGRTTVAAVRDADDATLASASVPGTFGLPYVTLGGDLGGLSTNGRTLVLGEPYTGGGELRTTSRFAVFGTKPLALRTTVALHGDFGFDALSPDGRTLYLIEHASQRQLLSYRVRAYDLRTGKLLPGAIADERQRSWLMNGMPVSRATTANGRWVYTLYSGGDNYPFVHALDTTKRTAVCVGLPWQWTSAGPEIGTAKLTLSGGRLVVAGGGGVGTKFALDTRTFKVTRL
jgi:hypothetical protein